MIDIQVKDEGLVAGLAAVAAGFRNPRPLMRAVAGLFETETERNFAAQGRPAWLGLAPRTKKRRGADAKILQDTGRLAGSITTSYDASQASVGTNVKYAAIHQFGGKAGRGRKVTIPTRPFLPFGADDLLQPSSREGVMSLTNDYLATLIGPR